MHTALDIAGMRDREEIVRFLDTSVAKQSALNKKVVKKLKEKSVLDAEKRIKKYMKLQEKNQRRLEKEGRRIGAEEETSSSSSAESSTSPPQSVNTHTLNSGAFTKTSLRSSNLSTGTLGSRYSHPMPYSEHVKNTVKSGKFTLGVRRKIKAKQKNGLGGGGDFKIAEFEADGKRSVKSLIGLRRDDHVMYVGGRKMRMNEIFDSEGNGDTDSIPYSEPAFHLNGNEKDIRPNNKENGETASIFERPGFGSVAFFNRPRTTNSLIALSAETSGADSPETAGFRRKGSFTDSIGTLGSLAARIRDLPWGEEDVEPLDDDEECSPLELFLVSNGLTDYLSLFAREQVDLEALLLLSDEDLKDLGVPLGPRRKIMDAIQRRKKTTENPPAITDTKL